MVAALTNAAKAVVVSVHYQQAPEHKFPASHDDALAAYRWVLGHQQKLKGNGKIAVAGESAGGNLAASLCMMARDQGLPAPVHQLLIYPVADTKFDTPSYRENAEAKPLNKAMMEWFFKHAASSSTKDDPRLAILRAENLRGLPPATIITAQIDPLRSEGQAYAETLKGAGVPVAYRNFDGVTHEFFGMGAIVSKAKEAQMFAGENLQRAFEIGAGAATGRWTNRPKQ